ncbi:MAG: alkaline phosphatase family protein, partial [Nitrosopumilaceae archaeon]
RNTVIVILVLIVIGLLLGLTLPRILYPATPTVFPQIGGGKITHVIIIVEENEGFASVIGNTSQAPYQNQLASQYALATSYFAIGHPSLPNYIAMTSGSTLGFTSDCKPTACNTTATNIVDLFRTHGITWKEYAESMPTPCNLTDANHYAPRHNPFVYYTDIVGNFTYCDQHIVSMNVTTGAGFLEDLNNNSLPQFSFITPNTCDDGHDNTNICGGTSQVSNADKWLANLMPKIIASSEFNSSAVFIVYDEGGSSSNKVVNIVVSPFAKAGYSSSMQYTHYSLLATVENIFNLGNLGRNDSGAVPMSELFLASSSLGSKSITS